MEHGARHEARLPTAFLGTQGDVWDTQEDMFMASDRRDLRLIPDEPLAEPTNATSAKPL